MFAKTLLYVLPAALAFATGANATPHDFTLENGLRVIVSEDRRTPVAAVRLTYRVGSHQEYPGLTGVSQVLKHLVTEENATVSHDATTFFRTLPKERLDEALAKAADMTSNLTLSATAFNHAIHAAKAARSSSGPEGQALASLHALLFPTSGYRTPPSGHLADLERLTLEDVKQWHASWYAPNNAVLVVVGDVDPGQVEALARRHFGPLHRRALPVSRIPLELDAPGERSMTLPFLGTKPRLYLAFNWPSYATSADPDQVAALRLLPYLLTESPEARLASRLMRDEQVLDQPTSEYLPFRRGASYFMITSDLAANTSHSKGLEKIWEQLQLLKSTPPTLE